MNELFDKNWRSTILLEIISIYSFWTGEYLATGLKLHQLKALLKVGEWVIQEELAICNTFRDNSHLLILSRWIISYGSETSTTENSSKIAEWVIWEELAICNIFRDNSHLLIWVGE